MHRIPILAVFLMLAAFVQPAFAGKQCMEAASTRAYQSSMEQMHRSMAITYTGDTDIDFVRGMIPHHQGAVDMANAVLKYGKDPEIRALAEWIIQAQKMEIAQMKGWLNGRYNPDVPAKNTPEVAEFKAVMDNMHHAMMIDYTGNADIDFVRGMIPHHQGAIDMAEIQLRSGKHRETRQLAWNIINTQQQEIGQMRSFLEKQGISSAALKTHKKKSHH